MERLEQVQYRKNQLKKLLKSIKDHESEIIDALKKDFRKSEFESYVTEISIVYSELKLAINKIETWTKPKKIIPSILNFPSLDYIYQQPYGRVLIISPWNYPFQLVFCPLIGAFTAGNRITVKPSELTPYTSTIISKIIREVFDPKHVIAILGDKQIVQNLLKEKWDYVFFTGSVTTGKYIYQAVSENLTPVTLELGGKNPCIVDETADIALAAKRIAWGKFINAGQTCIAPDYILIHQDVKDQFLKNIQKEIITFYGENPEISEDFPRIINKSNFLRLQRLLSNQKIIYGGVANEDNLYISPTIIDEPSFEDAIMLDEIFGPILPIISYKETLDINLIIRKFDKPLALYYFTKNIKLAQTKIQKYHFGGGCINDVLIHFSNKRLPFGGVGNSGIGNYHGKRTFEMFSHQKSIVKKANWLDIKLRYPPYKNKIKWLKKIL